MKSHKRFNGQQKMDTKIKPQKKGESKDSKEKDTLGAVLHHVTMFVIGCAIGGVLTMLYTSFLPIGNPSAHMSQHRRIMTKHVQRMANVNGKTKHDFSIFADMRKPGADPSDLRRMKRNVDVKRNANIVPHNATTPSVVSTTPATTPATTTKPTTSPVTSTGAITPNATILNRTCAFTDLKIQTHCQIPFQLQQLGLNDMSLHDVISSVYSDQVLAGWSKCPPGTWCPQVRTQWDVVTKMAERWGNGNFQAQICPLLDCLSKLPNASNYCEAQKRHLVVKTVTLLCSMPMTRETKLRDITCVKRILMMEHLDLSDISRRNTTVAKDTCSGKSCNQQCAPLFTEFADMDLACDSYRFYIRNFGPWKWFYQSRLKENCGVEPSINRGSHFSFAFIGKYRNQIIILGTLSTVVLLLVIGVSSMYFWRKRRVVYKRAPSIEGELAEMEGLLVT